jgi:ferritin
MLSKTMQDALNEQINHEMYSAYLYLAMAAHFESENLPGFARWMRVQYKEEVSHGMKFFDYICERGGAVLLKAIGGPPVKFKSPLEIFAQVLEHEQKITKLINKLYELALKEKDYPSQVMLQWFIKEQVEEEKNDMEIIALLEMVGEAPAGMVMLDRQLGARTES